MEIEKLVWHNEQRKLSELLPASYNPRKLSDKSYKDLRKSLEKFNLSDLPSINLDNTVISGHQRIRILSDMNGKDFKIDVRVPNRILDKKEEKELNIRSNRNLGEWDWELMGNEFDVPDLLEWGFEEKDLGFDIYEEEEKDNEVPDLPETPITQLGDVYELNGHRVQCGDSTQPEAVLKLMDGKKADMSFTSPPYNVGHNLGYEGKDSKYENSDDDLVDYQDLIVKSTELSLESAKEVFVNIQFLANNKKDILKWLANLAENFKDIFFWKKLQVAPAMAENVANSQVEVIVLFGHNNTRAWGNQKWRGNFSNAIETNSASLENENSKIHNATFPVDLPLQFITHAYKEGSIILDLFIGTGTTLIACEKTNRICYGMELDPLYVDVTISRWCKYTGINKIKKNGKEIEWEV